MKKKDFDSLYINIYSKLEIRQNKRRQYEDLKISFYNEGKITENQLQKWNIPKRLIK